MDAMLKSAVSVALYAYGCFYIRARATSVRQMADLQAERNAAIKSAPELWLIDRLLAAEEEWETSGAM
jgi:hypothetical protein